MTVGEAIKKARLDKGYTQQQLSDKSGVHYVSILNYEKGKSLPNLDSAIWIADALGISLDKLVGRERECIDGE